MAETIPPKGQTGVTITVEKVPHGVDVVVALRSLTLPDLATNKRAMLFAWRALGVELEALGCNLLPALLHPPEPIARDVEGDSDAGPTR